MSQEAVEVQNDLQLEDVEDYTSDYPPDMPGGDGDITAGADGQRRSLLGGLVCGNKKLSALVGIVVVLVITIVAIVLSGGNDVVEEGFHQPLILIDPSTLDASVTGPLFQSLEALYDRHNLDSAKLQPAAGDASPFRRAFYWLAYDNQQIDHSTKMTRFVLAAFYYTTNQVKTEYNEDPKTWYNARRWLTKAHVCEWHGVECDDKQRVTGIVMERNFLSGYLPQELIILEDTLERLSFSSNGLHMQDDQYDLFENLEYLEEFTADDNFLEYHYGLPSQMKWLVNLEKLVLSYNLMEGQIDPKEGTNSTEHVLSQMTALTHLEIESNFFSGTMPGHVGRMDRLVYLYARRNNLNTNLDFLKSGKMEIIFALWLDGNQVTGTIPTQIGELASLGSLSLANSKLSGPIPTEMGKLAKLQRVWLYNNQLTGTIPAELTKLNKLEVLELHGNKLGGSMPNGICSIFEKSTYDFKALTSDCKGNTVDCKEGSCCTRCY